MGAETCHATKVETVVGGASGGSLWGYVSQESRKERALHHEHVNGSDRVALAQRKGSAKIYDKENQMRIRVVCRILQNTVLTINP